MSNTAKCKGCDGMGHLSGENCPDCDGLGVQVVGEFCTDYAPDIQAQGDCINCGWGWEHHQETKGQS